MSYENLKTITFAQNILPSQREQLHDWLSDHPYAEVQALIAGPPPDGFGLEVSIPTLSRYYKKNFESIDELRHRLASETGSKKPGQTVALADCLLAINPRNSSSSAFPVCDILFKNAKVIFGRVSKNELRGARASRVFRRASRRSDSATDALARL